MSASSVVLCYHRVADVATDPELLAVSPVRFAEQMNRLRELGRPSPLLDLVNHHDQERRVVVTFDDGYVDNLTQAKPLLERWEIPATVFVTSGFVGREREPWWDELQRLFLLAGQLPRRLDLTLDGVVLSWDLGRDAVYLDETFKRYADWNVFHRFVPTRRHEIYIELARLLKPLTEQARTPVLDALRAWAESDPRPRDGYRAVTADELTRLAGGMVDIGGHTRTHPVLAELGADEQRREIAGSKADLEALLGRNVRTFSYPFGTTSRLRRASRQLLGPRRTRADVDARAIRIASQVGFACACATSPGRVTKRSRAHALPRVYVRNWTGDEFIARILAIGSVRQRSRTGF